MGTQKILKRCHYKPSKEQLLRNLLKFLNKIRKMAISTGKIVKFACLESSIHGLKYIYLFSSRLQQIFWIVICVSFYVFALILSQLLSLRYLSLPTRMVIEDQFTPVSEIFFPSVTVCTPNQLKVSNVDHFLKTLLDKPTNVTDADIMAKIPHLLSFYNYKTVNLSDMELLEMTMDLNRYKLKQVMKILPQACKDYIVQCSWAGDEIDCSEHFHEILTEFGLCCTFNNKYGIFNKHANIEFKPLITDQYGPREGLSFFVNYEPDQSFEQTLVYGGASRIMIHDSYEYPHGKETFMVIPKTESFHGLRSTYTNSTKMVADLPMGSRKCVFGNEFKLAYFEYYHNANCEMECFMNETLTACGCIPHFYPHWGRTCTSIDLPCLIEHERTIGSNMNRSILTCECPKECESRDYEAEVTTGNLEALQHDPNSIYDGIDFATVPGLSVINVFHRKQFFTKMRQEFRMTSIQLISNLGGVFGLCLGFSLLSIFEVIHLLTRIVVNCFESTYSIK